MRAFFTRKRKQNQFHIQHILEIIFIFLVQSILNVEYYEEILYSQAHSPDCNNDLHVLASKRNVYKTRNMLLSTSR